MERAPRVTHIDVELKVGEEMWITPLSDLHTDSSTFDEKTFQRQLAERNAANKNHRAILIGDNMDLVVPRDLKRWRASAQDGSIAARDDWTNAAIDLTVERLKCTGTKIDLVCPGNHEDEFLKRYGLDVTSILARELGAVRGGYSGVLVYNIRTIQKSGKKQVRTGPFRILYHHGAWGGRVVKGFGGARDWARHWTNWHIFCYGHNHQEHVHREMRLQAGKYDKLITYPVYYVNTGSFCENYSMDGKITHYSERAGLAPTITGSPLIKIKQSNTTSNPGWKLEYVVEI